MILKVIKRTSRTCAIAGAGRLARDWVTRTVKSGMYIYTLTSLGSSVSGKLVIK